MVKNLFVKWKMWVQSLGWGDTLEKKKQTHSSILDWKIPWTEESSGLQSMGLQSWSWTRLKRLNNNNDISLKRTCKLSGTVVPLAVALLIYSMRNLSRLSILCSSSFQCF